MIKLIDLLSEADEGLQCPISTQNSEINAKRRLRAIRKFKYGPYNPNNPNVKFWEENARVRQIVTIEEAKISKCHNCSAFNITSRMLNCIGPETKSNDVDVRDIDSGTDSVNEDFDTSTDDLKKVPDVAVKSNNVVEDWDNVEAGREGYCMLHKFKSTGSRTCNAWKAGGPIKD